MKTCIYTDPGTDGTVAAVKTYRTDAGNARARLIQAAKPEHSFVLVEIAGALSDPAELRDLAACLHAAATTLVEASA